MERGQYGVIPELAGRFRVCAGQLLVYVASGELGSAVSELNVLASLGALLRSRLEEARAFSALLDSLPSRIGA